MSEAQRREFHEALLDAANFEDLPGKWQAAILKAEQGRPKLHLLPNESPPCIWAGVASAGDRSRVSTVDYTDLLAAGLRFNVPGAYLLAKGS
jgi:hypothetical protein